MNGVPHVTRQAPGKRAAIVLAIAVHVALIVFLVYGVRWQTKTGDVVQVDLVSNVPSPAPAASAPPPPPPAPKVEPKPEPKLEPRPEPKAPPLKPDIVIKEKEKPKPKPEPMAPPLFDPTKLLTQDLAQASKLATEETDKQQAAQAAAAAKSKAATTYEARIRSKIRGNIILPPDIRGNPVAKFVVVQLPTGEIISHRLTKPSGNPAYDDAVERAILKSSPLPKPDDPSLFERQLELTFCPQESGCS
jgi:colicin import membrane protein